MKITYMDPKQIISSSHEILHNIHVLKIYFKVFKEGCGDILPSVPVIHRNIIEKHFAGELSDKFIEYISTNPQAEYFLLDGSHKTTAADLTDSKCKVMIIENNEDIEVAKGMETTGEVFEYRTGNYSIESMQNWLTRHFSEKMMFQTVEEKTAKLVESKEIPEYMIKYYEQVN
ncbi:MAG TPA: hypothetical protein DCP90_01430 [Clostridiales bacterium]|nr:MAG: hypothetical protein A2Y22_05360 [Clostridiales bacterium GWD2_32_59]HAN09257.1 hypothetical protein [Clostridiales bacterium]